MILFLNKEACSGYRQVMIDNYELSGGIWTTNCVSYNVHASKGMIVLESTPHLNKQADDNIFQYITRLKCIELDIQDELNIYDLNLVTSIVYFMVTNFENDAVKQIITLHGVFSQKSVKDETAYKKFSDLETNHKQEHIINFMNRIYKK